jgi:hypothetical protein
MIKKLTFAGTLATLALLAQGPPMRGGWHEGPMGFGGPGMGAPVTGAPYSATEVVQSQQTLANGSQISSQETSTVYRDSQGRTRTERTMPASPDGTRPARNEVTIFDPVAGTISHLDSAKKTYVQMAIRQHNAAGAPAAASHARRGAEPGQTETLAAQAINGLPSTGTRHTMAIPAGKIGNSAEIDVVRETWISQDLKVPVMIKTNDPRFGTRTMQLTNVVRSEPDAALFQIPAGYSLQAGHEGGPGRGHGGPPPSLQQ